jgi:glyoxylase-like metal-dependent hydrolase (beta-lactamase superfamily II)
MSVQDEVDRLIDERPGKELLTPAYDDPAFPINGFLWRSGGTSASYLLVTREGRVIVNTGMGWEAPHHQRVFDAICPGPTPYVITTQGHVDHVGGVALFREPGTRYVAQAANAACQADDARIAAFRAATAGVWFGGLASRVRDFAARYPGAARGQDRPTPDLVFDHRLALRVGELDLELVSAPGGETLDSCVVWLPRHRIALVSNLFGPLFPHFPNFHTLRGDRYRLPEPYLASVRTVRELQPELLVTGRHLPIAGRALIDAALGRLHDAVDFVHRETLVRINAGQDALQIMREVELPARLRVGQGYGRVSWAVRTIWEAYTGWFQRRSTTELHGFDARAAQAELVELAGAAPVVERARARLAGGDALAAIHLAEAVLAREPSHRDAARVLVDAHRALLAAGGDANFWESGWLHHQLERWGRVAGT